MKRKGVLRSLMEVVVAQQTVLFLQACLMGFMLGLCYEPFRIMRLMTRSGAFTIFLEDIVYWLFCAFVSFLFILTVNSGQLRIFMVVGILIGMVIYFFTLGALIVKASKAIASFLRRAFRFLHRTLVVPIEKFIAFLRKKTGKFYGKVQAGNKKIQNNVNYRLKQHRVLLYNLIHTKKTQDGSSIGPTGGDTGHEKRRKNKQNTSHH